MKANRLTKIQKDYIWNLLGSTINAFSTVLLSILATRIVGVEGGGIVGFSLGLAFVLMTIGTYEIRTYQVTDTSGRLNLRDYNNLRILTSVIMGICIIGYVLFAHYPLDKSLSIALICLTKLFEGVSDVYQGYYQQQDQLYMAGKILFFQILIEDVIFVVTLFLSKDLTTATLLMVISSVLYTIFIYQRFIRQIVKKLVFSGYRSMLYILKENFPIFIGTLLLMWILNMTKFEVERICPELQAYWNAIFMPTAVINLISIFLLRPMLIQITKYWYEKNVKKYFNIVIKQSIWIVLITIFCVFGMCLVGIPILELLYGIDLEQYRTPLMIVMIGGGFNAFSNLLFYAITVVRKQEYIIIVNGITAALSKVITYYLVLEYSLSGAAYSYLLIMFLRVVLFIIFLSYFFIHDYKRLQSR